MTSSNQPQEPEWLAKPSGDCCLKGHIHTGKPKGSYEWIADVETYVVHPPTDRANGHIVLYYPDVFGFFTNGLLIMDEIADAGYIVLGLDYFQGDPIYLHRTALKQPKPGFDFDAWLAKYHKFAEEHVPSWIDGVKQKYGKAETKYACVGYCFGAPYVCNSLASADNTSPACDVGAFAHPAFLKEHHFAKLQRPLFLSCAETDHTFPTEARNSSIDMLRNAKKPYHLQLFSGVEHGFALRCNLDVPYERWVKETSLKGIVEYFDFWLGAAGGDGKGSKL